jgi:hypothetical protein
MHVIGANIASMQFPTAERAVAHDRVIDDGALFPRKHDRFLAQVLFSKSV